MGDLMAHSFRTAKRWITKRVIPDYTNQIDLFSQAQVETPTPVVNAPAQTSSRPRLPQQLTFGEWQPLPPEDAVRTSVTPPAPANTGADGGTVRHPPARSDIDAHYGISPGKESGDERDPAAGRVFDIDPEEKPSRDFRITGAHRIGQGGLQEKARDNIAAIRLLKM